MTDNVMARALADASDAEQADFFNSFAHYLQVTCGGEVRAQGQIRYMADKLDGSGAWLAEELHKSCVVSADVARQRRMKEPTP